MPEPITVKHVLDYDSVLELTNRDLPAYSRLWRAAKKVMRNWAGPFALDADLDTLTDLAHVDVVKWAGMQVLAHITAVKQVPKNS